MWLSCIPSRNLASEPLAVAPVVPVVPVKKSVYISLCDTRFCVPCVPVQCCKKPQPPVLSSTPPDETPAHSVRID